MGASHTRLVGPEREQFFTSIPRRNSTLLASSTADKAAPTSDRPSGDHGHELGVRWLTDGITAHGAFIVNDMEDAALDEPRAKLLQELLDLNPETQRVELLLHLCCMGLDQAMCNTMAAAGGGGGAAHVGSNVPQTVVGFLRPLLRLTTVVLRHIIASAQGDSILLTKQIDRSGNGSDPSPAHRPSIHRCGHATRLCQLLIDFTIKIPLDAASVLLHYEATSMLLSLCSTQLYHPSAFDEQRMDVFVEAVLASDVLLPFFATVLQRLVAWGTGLLPDTAYVYRSGYQPSFKNLFNLFGSVRNQHCASVTEWLGRHSAQLLTLLVLHQRGNGSNRAADCFRQLTHGEFVDFEMLLSAVERKVVSTPCLAGLLYVLLVDHPSFLHTTLTTWPERMAGVVVSLLHLATRTAPLDYVVGPLTTAPPPGGPTAAAAPHPNVQQNAAQPPSLDNQRDIDAFQNLYVQYQIASILCILSKDRTFHGIVFQHYLEPSFVQDRYLKSISVGSLMLAICAKAVARALSEQCDALAHLYLSAIENASPFACQLDPYASQRVLGLLVTLLKRIQKIEAQLIAQDREAHQHHRGPGDTHYQLLADREALLVPTQYLAESIAAMLEGQHRGNHTLTYELLYHRNAVFDESRAAGTVVATASAPSGCDGELDSESEARRRQVVHILSPLRTMIESFEAEMASVAVNHSPEDILALIERVSNSAGAFFANDGAEATGGSGGGVASGDETRTTHAASTGGGGEKHHHASATSEWNRRHQGRELLYLYQESKEAHTFFTPFVWSTMVSESPQPGAIRWIAHEGAAGGRLAVFYPNEGEGG